MRSHQLRIRSSLIAVAAMLLGLIASECCGLSKPLKITIPSDGSNFNDGAKFAVAGNVQAARHRNDMGTGWIVDNPNVLLELYLGGDLPYFIGSKIVGVSFSDDVVTAGAFNGELTATQMGGYVYPYEIDATALDSLNERTNKFDWIWIAIVKP